MLTLKWLITYVTFKVLLCNLLRFYFNINTLFIWENCYSALSSLIMQPNQFTWHWTTWHKKWSVMNIVERIVGNFMLFLQSAQWHFNHEPSRWLRFLLRHVHVHRVHVMCFKAFLVKCHMSDKRSMTIDMESSDDQKKLHEAQELLINWFTL